MTHIQAKNAELSMRMAVCIELALVILLRFTNHHDDEGELKKVSICIVVNQAYRMPKHIASTGVGPTWGIDVKYDSKCFYVAMASQ